MKIYKKDDKLVVELDLFQHRNNCYSPEEEEELTDNLIGVIAGDDFTISQLNDLSYKGDQQEGPALVHFFGSKEEFLKLCKELDLNVWEHEACAYCRGPIYGSCRWGDEGAMCYSCELDEEKEKSSLKKEDKEGGK